MRKLVNAAASAAIIGSTFALCAGVAGADAPPCPAGWHIQTLKRGDDFADKNGNGLICELNIGVKNGDQGGNSEFFIPKGGNSNEPGFVVKDDNIGTG
jgi:hypothetical protein